MYLTKLNDPPLWRVIQSGTLQRLHELHQILQILRTQVRRPPMHILFIHRVVDRVYQRPGAPIMEIRP